MSAFFLGVLLTVIVVLIVLIGLRLVVPDISRLFAPRPIPYEMIEESTEWLNFVLYRVMTHLQKPDSVEKIAQLLRKSIPYQFELRSIGNAPTIGQITTVQKSLEEDTNDVHIIVPIDVNGGPSIDLELNKYFHLEFDLFAIAGKVLIDWPDQSDAIKIHLGAGLTMNYDLAMVCGSYGISLSDIPLLGPIVSGCIVWFLSRLVIIITIDDDGELTVQTKTE